MGDHALFVRCQGDVFAKSGHYPPTIPAIAVGPRISSARRWRGSRLHGRPSGWGGARAEPPQPHWPSSGLRPVARPDEDGAGLVTGKINESTAFDRPDFRNILPRFTPEARKANQALVDLLGKIGEQKKATPAQIALAWLLAQKPWIVPIPGTTKLHRLDENIGAAAVELTSDDLREIDSAASQITVHGARYPEELMKMTGR